MTLGGKQCWRDMQHTPIIIYYTMDIADARVFPPAMGAEQFYSVHWVNIGLGFFEIVLILFSEILKYL